MLDHLGFYFFLTIINFIFVKYFKKIKLFHTNMDIPDKKRKAHKFPVALAGGLIITFNLFFLLVYLTCLVNEFDQLKSLSPPFFGEQK